MNNGIKVTLLGGAGHVGKSCFLLEVNGFRILLDCGMQMNETSIKGIPSFEIIQNDMNELDNISAILITHTHLDHCGALPYVTEVLKYEGPIFMSYPTKALFPLLMHNFISILAHQTQCQLTSESIVHCLRNVHPLDVNETFYLAPSVSITATIAGHMLGAVMYTIDIFGYKIVYTGDFNLSEDHFLPQSSIPSGSTPDLLLCESTYGNVNYKAKDIREKEVKDAICNTLNKNGKVLISEYPIGRAQELLCIIEQVLEEHHFDVPIYYNSSLAQSSLPFFRIFSRWTNRKNQSKNTVMFPHLQKMNPNLLTPQCKESFVLLSTPPFFQKGVSLTALQLWGPNPKNLILIPGKCIQGTVGNDLCNGKKAIYIDKQPIIIESTVMNISLSQHCDQNDLLQFINLLKPDSIMFIHGDLSASNTLKQILVKQSHYRADHIYIPKDKETVVVNPLKLRYNCCSSVFQMEKDCYFLSDPIELSTTSEDSYSHKQKYTQDQYFIPVYSTQMDDVNILTTTSPFYSKRMNAVYFTEQYVCSYSSFLDLQKHIFLNSYFTDGSQTAFIYNHMYFYVNDQQSSILYVKWNHTQQEDHQEVSHILAHYFSSLSSKTS